VQVLKINIQVLSNNYSSFGQPGFESSSAASLGSKSLQTVSLQRSGLTQLKKKQALFLFLKQKVLLILNQNETLKNDIKSKIVK
jgi:hypothetical protein